LQLSLRPGGRSHEEHRGNVLNRLYTVTIGTLLAAKLIFRLETGGKLEFEGDPAVWEKLEQMSDDVAEKFFVPFAKSPPWSQTGGIRLYGEREYLHLMRDRKTFRWCKTEIQEDEPMPSGIRREQLDGTAAPSLELAYKILTRFGNWRRDIAGDERQARFEMMAQIIGIMGAAKLLLALWGNGKEAAALEWLAEKASEREYDDLKGDS
jgi:hypothetical protein